MRASVAIILGAVIVSTGFLYWYFTTTQDYVEKTNSERAAFVQEMDELNARVIQERIDREEEIKRMRRDPSSIGVIINKKHPVEPIDYAPSDLVMVKGATLSKKVMSDFSRMFSDAEAAGQPFYVTSSYRSYQTQVLTYNHWVSVNGQKVADTYSAKPGYSEHQTGFVVDVAASGCTLDCFGATTQYKWLRENAANYGFIQRYHAGEEEITGYKAEEWHYRYVGVDVAQDMKSKGVKSLEAYWGYLGGDYES